MISTPSTVSVLSDELKYLNVLNVLSSAADCSIVVITLDCMHAVIMIVRMYIAMYICIHHHSSKPVILSNTTINYAMNCLHYKFLSAQLIVSI